MTAHPLTVMQLLPNLHGGGVERGTIEVARALVEAGHRSVVVSGGGAMTAELASVGSEHVQLDVGRKSLLSLRHVRTLRRLWAERDIDIVHARSRVPAWLSYLGWRNMDATARPRFVTTVHGAYSVNAYSEVMLKGESVIAVSNTIADYIKANYPGFDESRLRVIHRGVDPTAFPMGFTPDPGWLAAWHRTFPELAGKRLVTLVGRLTRLKGHDDFLELIKTLSGADERVHGLIVGGEEQGWRARYAHELHQKVRLQGLPITFTGHRTDIREIYSVSGVVVSLSTQPESFGRSVLEALRLGVPVAGYDHGGVGEILRAVFPRGTVPLGDKARTVEKVRELLGLRRPLEVPDRFRLDTMLDDTLALYGELAARRAKL